MKSQGTGEQDFNSDSIFQVETTKLLEIHVGLYYDASIKTNDRGSDQ